MESVGLCAGAACSVRGASAQPWKIKPRYSNDKIVEGLTERTRRDDLLDLKRRPALCLSKGFTAKGGGGRAPGLGV